MMRRHSSLSLLLCLVLFAVPASSFRCLPNYYQSRLSSSSSSSSPLHQVRRDLGSSTPPLLLTSVEKPAAKNNIFRFIKLRVVNIMAIAAFFFLHIDSSFAAKRAADNGGSTATIYKPTKVKSKGKRKGKRRSTAAKVAAIETAPVLAPAPTSKSASPNLKPFRANLPEVDGALLTKIGYGAAVASIVLAVISDDGEAAKRRNKRSRSNASYSKPTGPKIEDDEDDSSSNAGYPSRALSLDSNRSRAGTGRPSRPSALPPVEELLGDIDDLFEPPPASISKNGSKSKQQQQAEEEDDLFDAPSNKQLIPGPPGPSPNRRSPRDVEAERLEKRRNAMAHFSAEAAEAPKAVPAKAKEQDVQEEEEKDVQQQVEEEREEASVQSPAQKKGIFDRIFSKPGGNRNTNMRQVLALKDDAQSFRREVASALASFVDSETFGDLLGSGSAAVDDEARVRALLDAKSSCGLSLQQAGDSFADVASAMLVATVDAAAAALDAGDEAAAVTRLDTVADFVQGAGIVFSKVAVGATIEPVLYNGSAKRSKLETLYFIYLKSTMGADNMMAMLSGSPATEDEGAALTIDRTTRLPSVQQVFSIKENKRSSLEQKALRENLMSIAGGLGGDGGGLGSIMDALSGKGGAGGMPDIAELEAMMKDMDPEALRGAAGLPDMDNMNPEEMAAMSRDAMSSVKAALQDGSITKSDISELEKVMGLDITQVVKMMDAGNVDTAKLKEMGPEFSEMLSVFKQLAGLKKKL